VSVMECPTLIVIAFFVGIFVGMVIYSQVDKYAEKQIEKLK